jgi:hypothetical protein
MDKNLRAKITQRLGGWLVGSDKDWYIVDKSKAEIAAYIADKWRAFDNATDPKERERLRGHLRALALADIVNWAGIVNAPPADKAELLGLVNARGFEALLAAVPGPNPGDVVKP